MLNIINSLKKIYFKFLGYLNFLFKSIMHKKCFLIIISWFLVVITLFPKIIFPNFEYPNIMIGSILAVIEIFIILSSVNFYNNTIKNYDSLKIKAVEENDNDRFLDIEEAETNFNFKVCSITFTIIGTIFFAFNYIYTQNLSIANQKITLANNFVSVASALKENDILSSCSTVEALANYAIELQHYGKNYIQKPLNTAITTLDFTRIKLRSDLNPEENEKYKLLENSCRKAILFILRENKYKNLLLDHINLSGLYLTKINLGGANLTEADLSDSDFSSADFSGADLRRVDLRHSILNWSKFKNADLSDADLRGANFLNADLRGANLSGADLCSAYLWKNTYYTINSLIHNPNVRKDFKKYKINLSDLINNSNLNKANLKGAKLRGTNLKEADLKGADLRYADFSGADLSCADFSGANLKETKNLTIEQLESAIISPTTKLPKEFKQDRTRLLKSSHKNLVIKKKKYVYPF